ncbi:MAG: DUF4145 domain-containing protein [Desulfobacteraceae bacterium]|nr:DUF4145 domain-containing protein [Desulfobacteraceae bacterium]
MARITNKRKNFAEKISQLTTSRTEQAIAFLWFYRYTQSFEERTASELASDLAEEGLGRPNVTVLHKQLGKNKKTVKGRRVKTFQLHTRFIQELNKKYGPLVNLKDVKITSSVLTRDLVQGTRQYLESMVDQVNGTYDYGFYDSCAVMIRRLMESLIIEVFIYNKRAHEIKINSQFLMLDGLIVKITNNTQIHLGRNTPKAMGKIKKLGDTAAHDRTYITKPNDIDDLKSDIRRTIQELLTLANIEPKK